ncbi:3'-5' exonuclease [Deinococcus pimensis]|uniref:3'-5' exonuclease n=1 Tax=Deinococcus pimensis TaxID=309888 RepID=UPI000484DEEC|nr:3'-5' exonuclease [Deinococcus pimensis]
MEYVVFDLETTGLSPDKDAIVEIGAMYVRDGRVIEAPIFHSLVNPGRPIPWYVTKVHGIRDEHVRGAPELGQIMPAFLDYVGDRPVVAHNVGFDAGFIRAAARRHGLVWAPPQEICTVQLSRRAFPGQRSHKLDLLAERFGLQFEEGGRHRSLGDVRVTAEAFVRLHERLGLGAR